MDWGTYFYILFFVKGPNFLWIRVWKDSVFRIRIHLIRFRIQRFRLKTDPDPIRIKGFDDQKFKNLQLEFFFLFKNYYLVNLPIPRPP